jgi:hypothetical protein
MAVDTGSLLSAMFTMFGFAGCGGVQDVRILAADDGEAQERLFLLGKLCKSVAPKALSRAA